MRKLRPRGPGTLPESTGLVNKRDRFEIPFSLPHGSACKVHDDILIRIIIFKCCVGARGTQSVQCLPCKHEDLSLIPEPCQTQDVVPRAYSHSDEKAETGKPLGLLVNQQSQISGFQVKVRDYLQQGVQHPEEIHQK